MNQERETPKFQGIADPKCRCTPVYVCRRCQAQESRLKGFYIGKFKEPWNAAVAKNNTEVKNGRD